MSVMRFDRLSELIQSRAAKIGVVGLGYVGLPVAVGFAEAGFPVIGIDIDVDRIRAVEEGRSFLTDVTDEQLASLMNGGRLQANVSYAWLADADVILVSLPTPLRDGVPDLAVVLAGAKAIAEVLSRGALVVLESTSYPGTTEEVLKPLLESSSGLLAGTDFFLAYSPERIDPGNRSFAFGDIPRIVGGIDAASTAMACQLYEQVVPKVVTVSGPREAEFAKLIENTFRHVNIALVNELAIYAHDLGIDIWEAIEAAATKPFGYLPFRPGPGWGGHCIPLDPSYLSWRIRKQRAHDVRFVELADAVNAEMPRYVVERATLLLNEDGKAVRGSKILGIGVAYKGGTEDTRGSGGLRVLTMLADRGAEVSYHDPLVPAAEIAGRSLRSIALSEQELAASDLILVLATQRGVDWGVVARSSSPVLDCCNALETRVGRVTRL